MWVRHVVRGQPWFQSRPSALFEAGCPVIWCEACKASCWYFFLSHCRVMSLKMCTIASSLTWLLGIWAQFFTLAYNLHLPKPLRLESEDTLLNEQDKTTGEFSLCVQPENTIWDHAATLGLQFSIISFHSLLPVNTSWELPVPGLLLMINGEMRPGNQGAGG